MESSLSGLRVVDLSHNYAGAYCTLLMAGFGAEVFLIEPSSGHPLRKRGPFAKSEADPHLCSREWFFGSPETAESFFMGFPFTVSGVNPARPKPGPALGEGNQAILGDLLGISDIDQFNPHAKEIKSAFHLD